MCRLFAFDLDKVLHLVPLDLQFRHMHRHVRWHVNIFHTHIHQRHLYMMDACQNGSWWIWWQRIRGPKCTNCCFNYSVWWKCRLCVECPFYSFVHWRACCAISGLSPKLLPSSPVRPLHLDKVYWTFTITLILKMILDPQSSLKLIDTTSFKLRPNKHLCISNSC